jgi:glycosyltransferase involved in cell wall biosynthesis
VIPILHLTENWRAGGTEAVVSSLLAGLGDAGFAPSLATLDPSPRLDRLPGGIPFHHLPGRFPLDPRAVARLAGLLRRGRFPLLHTHQVRADLAGAAGARLAGGPPVISTRHETLPFRLRRGLRGAAFRAMDRRAAAASAATVCISAAVRDFLTREEGIPEGRLSVIHNGIDPALFAPLAKDEVARGRTRAGIDPGGPVIGFLGRLEQAKGADLLPAIWERVRGASPAATLVIAGEGSLGPSLKGLPGKVLLPGRVEPEGLLPLLDLLLVPSRSEGFSLAVIEAAACGVPAVAFAVGGLVETIADGETGALVAPDEVGALAQAVTRLAGDPAGRARMGERARGRAVRDFSREGMLRAYIRLYRSLLGGEGE